ncbi:MAG: DEAD/DEAH box helicase [Cytophagales bacterium]
MNFNVLGLSPPILKALKEKKYHIPTEIQQKAIPLILQKADILGSAQTGTGKTAAFALPIIQLIDGMDRDGKKVLRSLIITPTRELAIQIGENVAYYSKHTDIRHAVVFGGVNQNTQTNALKRGVDILIATPGRLLDLINQGYIKLDTIKLFVLDEADRMLDMGFINDIKKIIRLLPEQRQSLFFSATMPDNIVRLSKDILRNPRKIEVSPVSSAAETIKQYIFYTNKSSKKDLLLYVLTDASMDQVLLFSRTKHGADKIARNLNNKNIRAAAIHGDKAQNNRQKVLSEFKKGNIRVLVATDIAARGIDIDKLRYVINYDIPDQAETYVHRIGRSGRAGESGVAISFSEPEENDYVRDIEKLIDKSIIILDKNPFPQTDKPMTKAEKAEFNKEKQRRKNEHFANRKKNRR